jgi:hypothetical protein
MKQFLAQARFIDQGILLADVITMDPRASSQIDLTQFDPTGAPLEAFDIILCRLAVSAGARVPEPARWPRPFLT